MTRDLRKYAKQTNVRLGIGAFFLLFIIGIGVIDWIYGPGAAIVGFLCLLGGVTPILLIILALAILEWINNRANPQ